MSVEELIFEDEKGDTQLTRMLSSMEQIIMMKESLMPLVERMRNIPGALEKKNKEDKDALLLAAINCSEIPFVFGYLASVMLLEGMDIHKVYDNCGNTLLHFIVNLGDDHQSIMTEWLTLLKMNSTVALSRRNHFDETALHLAVKLHLANSNADETLGMTYLLLEAGADLSVGIKPNHDTVLHIAVSLECDPKLVWVILIFANPTIVNMRNNMGNTPLHLAAKVPEFIDIEEQVQICQLLIKAGALTNVENGGGQKPFDLVPSERKEILKEIFYPD